VEKLEGLVAKNGGQAAVVEMGEEFRLLTLQVGKEGKRERGKEGKRERGKGRLLSREGGGIIS